MTPETITVTRCTACGARSLPGIGQYRPCSEPGRAGSHRECLMVAVPFGEIANEARRAMPTIPAYDRPSLARAMGELGVEIPLPTVEPTYLPRGAFPTFHGCRSAWRCGDCLGVIFVEPVGAGAAPTECPHCGGGLDRMGYVVRNSVVRAASDCPCDERCQFAKGPKCDCSCGGCNHGCGALWKIVRVGDATRLEAASDRARRDSGKLAVRGAEWRATVELATAAWHAKWDGITKEYRDVRASRGWMPPEGYKVYAAGQADWRELEKWSGSTSAARLGKMQDLIDRMAAK